MSMDPSGGYVVHPVGWVRSDLKARASAPKQGGEGAPDAWIEVLPAYVPALLLMEAGQTIVVLTWLHQARREVLEVHPRGDASAPLTGVFATRSPDRPNPVGLHRVEVLAFENGFRLKVRGLEAIDGTPVVDIKPALQQSIDW